MCGRDGGQPTPRSCLLGRVTPGLSRWLEGSEERELGGKTARETEREKQGSTGRQEVTLRRQEGARTEGVDREDLEPKKVISGVERRRWPLPSRLCESQSGWSRASRPPQQRSICLKLEELLGGLPVPSCHGKCNRVTTHSKTPPPTPRMPETTDRPEP